MYSFEPLTLDHQKFVEERLKNRSTCLSEYQFANLFLFRHVHRYELLLGQLSFIRGVTYDGVRHLLPIDSIIDDLSHYRQILAKEADVLYPLVDFEADRFRQGPFVVYENEEDRDYLYSVEKLSTYPGRKLAGRRNLVKQFIESTPHRTEALTVENREDARQVLKLAAQDDSLECNEALDLLDELSLEGLIVYTEDQPIAFAIGSTLSRQCYLFHFAKALPEYKGLFQFLYEEFAKTVDRAHWIDLEQDKGVEGLRRAKRAYDPDIMGIKWRVGMDDEA
jgi:hypothetical protein